VVEVKKDGKTFTIDYESDDDGKECYEEDVKISRLRLITRGHEFQEMQKEQKRRKKIKNAKACALKYDLPELGQIVEILWKEADGSEWWYVAIVVRRKNNMFTAYFPSENNETIVHLNPSDLDFRTPVFQGGTFVAKEEGISVREIVDQYDWDVDIFVALNTPRLPDFNEDTRLRRSVVLLTPEYPAIIPCVSLLHTHIHTHTYIHTFLNTDTSEQRNLYPTLKWDAPSLVIR